MPYCGSCGSEVDVNAQFCGNCGAARNQNAPLQAKIPPVNAQPTSQSARPKHERLAYYSPPTTPPPSAPLPMMQTSDYTTPPVMHAPINQAQSRIQEPVASDIAGEATIGVILLRKPKSLGRWDTYTGVVTTQRFVFAQMTSEMLKVAVEQSREQAKAQGKGFFGQWSEQLKATWGYSQRYLSMPVQAILAETPGNFFLYNSTVSEVKIKLKGDGEGEKRFLVVEFYSNLGMNEFHMDENSDFTGLLKQVFGDRVKMPFGYFSKSINIKL
jgi:hypothetical protein